MIKKDNQLIFKEYPYAFLVSLIYGTKVKLQREFSRDVVAGIQYAYSTLDELEQAILWYRFGEDKSLAEASVHFDAPKENIEQIETRAFRKLRLPGRWNYIQYGIMGYMRKRIEQERNKAYHTGYCDGYQKGKHDIQKGVVTTKCAEDVLDLPLESMGLSTRCYNCMSRAGCQRVRDVVALPDEKISRMRNLGPKAANEIAQAVQKIGIYRTAWDKYLL